MIAYNTALVLIGVSLLGASAGLVGSFAVLRRRALTGDALAHAALPGLCVAFLVVGERNFFALLAGAFVTGVLGVNAITALRRWTRIKEDAAIGIVLSVFFGVGIVLSRVIQNRVSGGSKAGLDSYILGKTAGMSAQDVYLITTAALFCLLCIVALYKECQVVTFDPDFARVQGWPTFWLDLLLMTLLAITVVIGLPAVGVVLIAALLILPGVTARFWTERLSWLLLLSGLVGGLTGLCGTWLSASFETLPAGPIIVLCGTFFFCLSALVAPRRGLIARWLMRYRLNLRVEQQTLYGILFDLTDAHIPLTPERIWYRRSWSPNRLIWLLRNLERGGQLAQESSSYRLTPLGLAMALAVARQHRLWQAFLSAYPDRSGGLLDLAGPPIEQVLPAALIEELQGKLRNEGRWPEMPAALGQEVSR